MKSLAAVAWGRGQPWSIEEIDVDPPQEGEVLVEWKAAGLCHSDEHYRSGDRVPPELESELYPLLGGHEGAGVVAEVGPDVKSLAVGDHVAAMFSPVCGKCRYCATGRGFICNDAKDPFKRGQLTDGTIRHSIKGEPLLLFSRLGTFSERTVVAERSLIKVEPDIAMAAASLVSCGVSTGWGSAVERAETEPGDVVVVVGVGGLGISAVQGARVVGAGEIVAIDPIASRRDQALKFGATRTAASITEAVPLIQELTWGQGADRVILTPSLVSGEMLGEAIEITAKGGICVVTGMGELGVRNVPIDIGKFVLYHKDIRGCLFGSLEPRLAAPRLLNLYRHGLLDLDGMVTTYPLDQINEGLRDSLEGNIVRGLLICD
jgi:NDMA-dependent alcohol dehydrogenase